MNQPLFCFVLSVFKRMDRRGNTSASGYEFLGREGAYGHYGCVAQKAAELNAVANLFAVCGDNSDCRGLCICNANRYLIGNDTADKHYKNGNKSKRKDL